MKCHYEVLNVARDANLDEIKKAYKKMAIKWHPDKNLDNTEAATEQFQLIQQAFDVLSDSHERAWYDDHRDAILKGKINGECEDDSLDVYQYFTASCYKGFNDDEKGFYSVYREVFHKIAAEDSEYYTDGDSDNEIPSFGKSDSSFEEVKLFYDYWQSYCTKKSYSWLDPYDSRTADGRRVSRLIDKENKKVRDKAKKARNEEVRELVSFVRKRDKRVQAYSEHLQKLSAEKASKIEERRLNQIKQRKKERESHQESDWSKFANLESELKNIEASIATEFGHSSSDDSSDTVIDDQLYCIACNKLFKTPKAFQNHEISKKHRENVLVLKEKMLEGSDTEPEAKDESDVEVNDLFNGTLSDELEDEFNDDPLHCNACGKKFKTSKAINEHKKTAKHSENYKIYREAMGNILEDDYGSRKTEFDLDPIGAPKRLLKEFLKNNNSASDKKYDGPEVAQRICNHIDEFTKDTENMKEDVERICKQWDELFDNAASDEQSDSAFKSGVRKQQEPMFHSAFLDSDEDNAESYSESKKNKKKKQKSKTKLQNIKKKMNKVISVTVTESDHVNSNEKDSETSSISQDSTLDTKLGVPSKDKVTNTKKNKIKQPSESSIDITSTCAACKETFPSKNKLFLHLSKTGHSVYIGDKETLLKKIADEDSVKSKKRKNKKNC